MKSTSAARDRQRRQAWTRGRTMKRAGASASSGSAEDAFEPLFARLDPPKAGTKRPRPMSRGFASASGTSTDRDRPLGAGEPPFAATSVLRAGDPSRPEMARSRSTSPLINRRAVFLTSSGYTGVISGPTTARAETKSRALANSSACVSA